jgi:hypothetical protein
VCGRRREHHAVRRTGRRQPTRWAQSTLDEKRRAEIVSNGFLEVRRVLTTAVERTMVVSLYGTQI